MPGLSEVECCKLTLTFSTQRLAAGVRVGMMQQRIALSGIWTYTVS
ncbi:hypothetical protein SAMN04487769_2162 [Burkholderia sp. b14]|nr:hypothetical protein SAMN04487768_2513 [Burkholderia sp. b13]SIT72983.1 hypothetical protein SAMN04487769_2162 [Burkholderia sp. b14]